MSWNDLELVGAVCCSPGSAANAAASKTVHGHKATHAPHRQPASKAGSTKA